MGQILVAGDSAGGNLALALLSHISRPSLQVPVVEVAEPVAGAVLISPWVTFATDSPCMVENRYKDCLDVVNLREWSSSYIGNAAEDNYTTPLRADANWWASLKVNKLYVIAGGDELFADDIARFADRIKAVLNNVEFFSSPGEAHDSPVLDFLLNAPDGGAARQFYKWTLEAAR
ncbi:hypothetical protein LTR10_023909 [Elasticomyces elasticus]|nr:hypothetical protein LTR10_023909 [Elasticomyces elasticus]KAK5020881.1 hypothetical protein LTS07_011383 [Exophiala sideris]KAK5023006.1 hypothetical protein LTR13_011352 [Exophiala sideris]KAK5176087.1 hypothetical protein LTR44_011362 [Eurotiomycetes sp. CCFEE 6388]